MGCSPLLCFFLFLFSSLCSFFFFPCPLKSADFSRGIQLLKCKNDDASQLDTYRGITLFSALSKIFESILLEMFEDVLGSDDLQFGFIKNTGCDDGLFAFNETVRYSTCHGCKVDSLFLDASKAFDKALHSGLYKNLLDRKAPLCFVLLLINWYSQLHCAVRWNGFIVEWFPIACGVRQGGVLSP